MCTSACVCVCVLQRHKNYCCQARQALSQSVINYFIECSLVFYPQSQSLETASTTRLGYESTRIVCAPSPLALYTVPSLSLAFVFSSVISGPRVAKFWKFFVAQNSTAQHRKGFFCCCFCFLVAAAIVVKLNWMRRRLSHAIFHSVIHGAELVEYAVYFLLLRQSWEIIKSSSGTHSSLSLHLSLSRCCFYKMIICTRNLTHSVSGHKSLNPSLTVWLSLCLLSLSPLRCPLFACQNQCRVLLSASAINKIHLDYKVHTKKGPLIRPVSHLAYFSSLKIYLKREQKTR